MTELVFFLEERSAEEMLRGLLPKLISESVTPRYVIFEGKQDLEKKLPRRLRAWQNPNAKFVVMRDQDSGDCLVIKRNLAQKCRDAGKPATLIRLACRELESFYLGDLRAVAESLGPSNLSKYQNKAKFRKPDDLHSPSVELKRLSPRYQKISGSRLIGKNLDPDNNKSKSFNVLVEGIKDLC